jgi:hypothetical protein
MSSQTTKGGGKDETKVVNLTSHRSDRKVWNSRKKGTDLVVSTTTTQIQEEIDSVEHWKKRFEEEKRKREDLEKKLSE